MSDYKVLIVEDDVTLVKSFTEILQENDYLVADTFDNGSDAINYLEYNSVDLVLLDISLKSTYNGIDTAEIIKKKYDIPIVFITGNVASDVYKKAKQVKPAGYILKPVLPNVLISTIDIAVQNYKNLSDKELIKKELQFKNIIEEVGEKVFYFFESFISKPKQKTVIVSTNNRFNIINQPEDSYDCIVNLEKINNLRRINKFLEAVNHKLPIGGTFIGHAETKGLRKMMILKKYPWGINYLIYFFHFIIKRVWPKMPLLKNIYFFITGGRNRALSRAEVLGRLISCGFEIVEESFIDKNLHFIVKKVRAPFFDMNASYNLVFKMARIGKNGKTIYVYKFRTMHPFSEYIQDYILKKHGYAENGKPAQDFRLTSWGRFMRKYWLDELPQLINVIKGEMKLVGVRPVSRRFLEEYPKDVLEMRLKNKPGCVPPYVALLKQNVEDYIEAEKTYLLEKEKNPYTTDLKYFFKAIYNIITNKIRSA